jgi:hypothetical protein
MANNMSNIEFWNDDDILISHLANQLKNNRLSIVLGAGVSTAFGLPGWGKLIDKMLSKMGEKCPPEYESNQEKANWIRERLEKESSYQEYIKLLHDSLYDDTDAKFEVLNTRKVLDAIATLCIPSRRGNVKDILTFNFDDILEIYLQYYGIISHSPFDGNQWRANADVNIYHIHGYLPKEKTINDWSKSVIFDKRSYDERKDYNKWEWAPKISAILRSTTTIFIGLSGEDKNLARFLKNTNKNHANKNHLCDLFWGVSFIRDKKNIVSIKAKWAKWGIFPIVIGKNSTCSHDEFENAIKSFLFGICQSAAKSI